MYYQSQTENGLLDSEGIYENRMANTIWSGFDFYQSKIEELSNKNRNSAGTRKPFTIITSNYVLKY